MTSKLTLQPIDARGWRAGVSSLIRKEAREWWATHTWWRQALLWLVLLNGIWGLVVFTRPPEATQGPGIEIFTLLAGIFAPLGVIIFLGDTIVHEKVSGTAAWIMSKPVSRSAFVLSKLVAHSLGFLFTIIVVPGLLAYLEASAAGIHITTAGFLSGLALLFLHLLFYLTLTVMLGTFFRSTTPVIGIPILLLFLQMGLTEFIGLGAYLPGAIPFIAPAVMQGEPLPGLVPVGTAAACSVLFSILAIWRFRREEF